MTMTISLKPAIKSDYLRGGPLQLKELQTRAPADKWLKEVKPGDKIAIEKVTATKGNFTQVKLVEPVAGESWWWCYTPYFSIPKPEEKKVPVGSDGLPTSVRLPITHLSQLDNQYDPYITCNLTSLATVMVFHGHPRFDNTGAQLEDQLYQLCERKGLNRHNHWHLKQIIEGFGYKDNYQEDAKWGDVKKWLASGKPCIVAGYFSRSGHILVISGYEEQGWIVQDPYGRWYYQEDGRHYYDKNASGANLIYGYQEMINVCGRDGDLWIHYVSR